MSTPQRRAVGRLDDDLGSGSGSGEATRKTAVACEMCRKQKIRCDMPDNKPPCGRCRKKRLPCAVGRSLQSQIEHDIVWKHEIERKIRHLEAKLEGVLAAGPSTSTGSLDTAVNSGEAASGPVSAPATVSAGASGTAHSTVHGSASSTVSSTVPVAGRVWTLEVDLESSPSSLPGLRLHNSLHPQGHAHTHTHAHTRPAAQASSDFVSRGVVTLASALRYHAVYQDRLDHFIYGLLGDCAGRTFAELYHQSPLLSTAVCAVGALHDASGDYEPLRAEFIALVSATCLSAKNDSDYVRALCIGAFWMSDLSSALSSIAVRVATELQLHRHLSQAIAGNGNGSDNNNVYQAYLDARLYYLVYACDHHLSIPHGRPPLTRECDAIRNVRRFLECRYANHDDARLVSHVLRWTVWTDIFDSLGHGSPDTALSPTQIQAIKRLSNVLDALRLEWADRLGPDGHVGNYPWKGAGMQHHFAKLYLCSHAFRGVCTTDNSSSSNNNNSSNNNKTDTVTSTSTAAVDMDVEVYELASSAVLAATCILRTVNSDREVQSFLNGLPTYFHVMIAFAVVFLLKVSTTTTTTSTSGGHDSPGLGLGVGVGAVSRVVDADEVRRLLTTSIAVLRDVTRTMHPQHLLVNITESAAEAVQRSYRNVNARAGGGDGGDSSINAANAGTGPGAESLASDGQAGIQPQQQRSDDAGVDQALLNELDVFFNTYNFLVDHGH